MRMGGNDIRHSKLYTVWPFVHRSSSSEVEGVTYNKIIHEYILRITSLITEKCPKINSLFQYFVHFKNISSECLQLHLQ